MGLPSTLITPRAIKTMNKSEFVCLGDNKFNLRAMEATPNLRESK